MRPVMLALGLAVAATACAPTDYGAADGPGRTSTASNRQCFYVSTVNNFRGGPGGTVYLRAGRDVVELQSGGGCRDVDWATSLSIEPDIGSPGSGRLCVGDYARIGIRGGNPFTPICRASVSRVLSPDEAAALPSSVRP